MKFTANKPAPGTLSLLGDLDRVEHAPRLAAAPASQRWTTRAQVDLLLAHPRIQELWPTGDYVAADPCAGSGALIRHVDHALGECKPSAWWANDVDAALVPPESYETSRGRIQWSCGDAARLPRSILTQAVVTNLPWFNVFARLVGHWRDVAFPRATIIALCDDQERTRETARRWLEAGNMPALIAQLPGRQSFDGGEDDGAYPWSVSWYVWRAGEKRVTSEVILL